MNSSPQTRVLLLGGSSEIALAITRQLASTRQVRPFLIGRDRERLQQAVAELDQAGCGSGEFEVLVTTDVIGHGMGGNPLRPRTILIHSSGLFHAASCLRRFAG